MNRRKRKQLLITAALIATVALPPLLLVGMSREWSAHHARTRLDKDASVALKRAERILANADSTLQQLATKVEPGCSKATLAALREAVYDTLYFREAGLIVDGWLVCTSNGVLDPPVLITEPEHQVPADAALHIAAPRPTLQPGQSIIVLHRTGEGSAVNLVLNPLQFGESLQRSFEAGQLTARLERTDGMVLLEIGAVAAEGELLSGSAASTEYPLRVVTSESMALLLPGQHRLALISGAVGIVISCGLVWLLLRLLRRRLAQGEELREALAEHEFRVEYQPVMDAMTGECVGAEALIRWLHPDQGLLLPDTFLPLAETAGLMLPITTWMMRRIAEDMAATLQANPRFHVSLNLSPGLLKDRALPTAMMRALGPEVPPWRIIFEITEEQLVQVGDGDVASAVDALRETGALLALDDFGTGYDSLKSLGDLPFDYLKIDKGLVKTLVSQPATIELVSAIVALAARLDLKVVAEGVEDAEQLDQLRALGVTLVQGWYFSKSLTADDFRRFAEINRGMPLDVETP